MSWESAGAECDESVLYSLTLSERLTCIIYHATATWDEIRAQERPGPGSTSAFDIWTTINY